MSKQDLPGVRVFGRPLKPVALGLTLTMVIIAQANFRGEDRGTEYPLSVFLAVAAAAAALTLAVGWIWGRQRIAEIGLLLVVGVYTARAAFIFMASGPDQSVFFSAATVIIAGGSYILEASEPVDGSRNGRRA